MFTKGEWIASFNPSVTGPTTPTITPVCGGRNWPYRTINIGEETIAIIPAPDKNKAHIPDIGEMEANAYLIASAPDLYEALKAIVALPDFAIPGKSFVQIFNAIAKAEGK